MTNLNGFSAMMKQQKSIIGRSLRHIKSYPTSPSTSNYLKN